ncbi:MAG: glycosyltransferase [Oscillospiraceae bacterium]|nr:glycosyltransferase [Oscillospiraceae bacterium]
MKLNGETINFSVSMCVYGGDDPICFDIALESIVNQTLKPAEIVLVVDGAVPGEIDSVIEKYERICNERGIRFCVYRLRQNKGHGTARRVSFGMCTHEWIALMDADDISVPDRFEKQIGYLNAHPDISVIGGNITEFLNQPDGRDISRKAGSRIVPETDAAIKSYMKTRCPMNQVTVMFSKHAVRTAGGYIDWYCEEDYYLWIRLALAGFEFANLNTNLVNVRVGEEMYQRRGGIRYFRSEEKLQRFMYGKRMIGFSRYMINVGKRLIVQVLMPNRIRGWVFRKFARQ